MISKKLSRLQGLLQDGNCSFAICTNRNQILQKVGIGVKPIMEMIREDYEAMQGAIVADKIIGKAAALLLVEAGVKEVYGEIMSETAQMVLDEYCVDYSYYTMVPYIANRTQDGMCPLEFCVKFIHRPEDARAAVEHQIQLLMQSKK